MAQGLFLFLGFLLVLCFPSANLQAFDGLPLSRLAEFGALALLLPFLILPGLRTGQLAFWKRIKIRPFFLWVTLAVILLLKGSLLASGVHTGFSGCYRSPADPAAITHEDFPPSACERSYENLFDRFSSTRLDSAIWFEPDSWNLVFLNTDRYDYYDWEQGNILRDRIPLNAVWNGVPEIQPGDTVRIEYVGEGTVAWAGAQIPLPPSYAGPKAVEFTPPADAALQIAYTFNDGSRSGQDPNSWGPGATIKVSVGKPGSMNPLGAKSPAPGWLAAALLADGLILLWLVSLLPALWSAVRRDIPALLVPLLAIPVISLLPFPPILRELGIAVLLALGMIIHLTVRPFAAISIYFSVIAAGLADARIWSLGAGRVLLRSAGNDPLIYESQAYSILRTGSLRAGESVFYFQPLYRYVLFLEHAIFGDGNAFAYVAMLALFLLAGFFLYTKTRGRAFPLWQRVILGMTSAAVILLGATYVSAVIRDGLSEYPTWILLLFALPLLFLDGTAAGVLWGSLALAFSLTVRVDQLPALIWIIVLAALWMRRGDRRVLLLAAAGTVLIGLLPLLHNLLYGHEAVLFTKGSTSAILFSVSPQTWLEYFKGSPPAAAAVREQWNALFLNDPVPNALRPTIAAMAVLLISWCCAVVYAVVRRKGREWPLLIVPLLFLAPHFFYNVTGYYPKYIFVAYLAMGAFLPAVWIRSAESDIGDLSSPPKGLR